MTINIERPSRKLTIGIPSLIFLTCFAITLLPTFKNNSNFLSIAIIGDLLITAPLIYLFLIRNSSVSKITALRIFMIGIIVAGAILNAESNNLIHILKVWVSPIIEGTLIIFVVQKFYLANKKAVSLREDKIDFLSHCRIVLENVFGNKNIGDIISSEIAVFYYAFLGRAEKNIDNKIKFSNYKKNGVNIILFTFLCLFILETTGVHFLLSYLSFNKIFVWSVNVLSLYTCLQLFAHIRSVKARAIFINDKENQIELHNGLAADASIKYDNIEHIEYSKLIIKDLNAVKIALINGLEKHNIVIKLKTPVEVIKIFGIKKHTKTILFFADEPLKLIEIIKVKLENL